MYKCHFHTSISMEARSAPRALFFTLFISHRIDLHLGIIATTTRSCSVSQPAPPAKKNARLFSRACSSEGCRSVFGRPLFPFFCASLELLVCRSRGAGGGGGVDAVDLTASLIVSRERQKSMCALNVASSGGCGSVQMGQVHCSSATGCG